VSGAVAEVAGEPGVLAGDGWPLWETPPGSHRPLRRPPSTACKPPWECRHLRVGSRKRQPHVAGGRPADVPALDTPGGDGM